MWSAGVILYAMLAGNLPFGKDLLNCPRFEKFSFWARRRRRTAGRVIAKLASANVPVSEMEEDVTAAVEALGYPEWFFPRHFSHGAKALLALMLEPEPRLRMTVRQARCHEWVGDAVACEAEERPAVEVGASGQAGNDGSAAANSDSSRGGGGAGGGPEAMDDFSLGPSSSAAADALPEIPSLDMYDYEEEVESGGDDDDDDDDDDDEDASEEVQSPNATATPVTTVVASSVLIDGGTTGGDTAPTSGLMATSVLVGASPMLMAVGEEAEGLHSPALTALSVLSLSPAGSLKSQGSPSNGAGRQSSAGAGASDSSAGSASLGSLQTRHNTAAGAGPAPGSPGSPGSPRSRTGSGAATVRVCTLSPRTSSLSPPATAIGSARSGSIIDTLTPLSLNAPPAPAAAAVTAAPTAPVAGEGSPLNRPATDPSSRSGSPSRSRPTFS